MDNGHVLVLNKNLLAIAVTDWRRAIGLLYLDRALVVDQRWAKRLLGELESGAAPFRRTYPYPVQVWKLGEDQLWISLGGEVVVDYALMFKAKYGRQTWVAGYSNDVMGYIPSRRVWEEGGRNFHATGGFTFYGLPAYRWAGDLQQRITATVERLVAGLP